MPNLTRFSALFIGVVLFAPILTAQLGTKSVADPDIGRPPHAPLITFLEIVNPGEWATDPSLPLKGSVAEVLYEELRAQPTPAGPAGEVVLSIRTSYDSAGHPVNEARTEYGSRMLTISGYERERLLSQESTFPDSKMPLVKAWSYWTYDHAGKLTEYRRGRGDEIQNHYLNFRRDGEGRLIGFEYRQGAKDAPFSRTTLLYSNDGKTTDFTDHDAANGEVTGTITQTVDERGHVVQMETQDRDWKTKKLNLPLKVTFRYDDKGRLIEQSTDAHAFEASGSENELPPGKISITYDDVKHTKTTEYSSQEGRLSARATLDSTGATTAYSGGTGDQMINVRLECTYDKSGNWTACRQISQSAAGPVVTKTWRRTITYR